MATEPIRWERLYWLAWRATDFLSHDHPAFDRYDLVSQLALEAAEREMKGHTAIHLRTLRARAITIFRRWTNYDRVRKRSRQRLIQPKVFAVPAEQFRQIAEREKESYRSPAWRGAYRIARTPGAFAIRWG